MSPLAQDAARAGAATRIRLERPKVRMVRAASVPISLLHVHHDHAAAFIKRLPDLGDPEAAGGSLDQPHAEARLQTRHCGHHHNTQKKTLMDRGRANFQLKYADRLTTPSTARRVRSRSHNGSAARSR